MALIIVGVNGVGKTTTIGKLASRFKVMGRQRDHLRRRYLPRRRRRSADRLGPAGGRAHRKAEGGRRPRRRGLRRRTGRPCPWRGHSADRYRRPSAQQGPPDGGAQEDQPRGGTRLSRGRRSRRCWSSTPPLARTAWLQAKVFSDVANIEGIVLTKLDGTAKGGIAVAIAQRIGSAGALYRPGRADRRFAALRRKRVYRRDSGSEFPAAPLFRSGLLQNKEAFLCRQS